MGMLHLSSRTEFVRAVNLDTGRTILLVGLPDEMVEWLDMGLPRGTPSVSEPSEVKGGRFDIIVWWIEKGAFDREMIDDLKDLLSDTGELWAIIPGEGALTNEFLGSVEDIDRESTLMITPDRDMVPVRVRRRP